MSSFSEIMKGATDIPLALLAFILGLLLRKNGSRKWSAVFLLIAAAALLGVAAHLFRFSETAHQLLWIVLYALIFESVRRFSMRMAEYLNGAVIAQRFLFLAEGVMYLGTVIALFACPGKDIFFFVAFLALEFGEIVVCLVKKHFQPGKAVILSALLLVPIVLQALTHVLSYAVVLEHLILLADELIVYSIGLESKTEMTA